MIELLDEQFCKSTYFNNYIQNIVTTDLSGKYGIYSFDGMDLKPIHPEDNIHEYCYFRQIGDSSIIDLNTGNVYEEFKMTRKFQFLYYNNDFKKTTDIISKLVQELNSINLNYTITSFNDNKLEVLKKEYQTRILEKYLIFRESTFISVQLELFKNINTHNCNKDYIC